jgi:hypothetical protein
MLRTEATIDFFESRKHPRLVVEVVGVNGQPSLEVFDEYSSACVIRQHSEGDEQTLRIDQLGCRKIRAYDLEVVPALIHGDHPAGDHPRSPFLNREQRSEEIVRNRARSHRERSEKVGPLALAASRDVHVEQFEVERADSLIDRVVVDHGMLSVTASNARRRQHNYRNATGRATRARPTLTRHVRALV